MSAQKEKFPAKVVPDQSLTLRPTPVEQLDLSARRLVIVGGTNGLGRAIAGQALARGAHVTVVGRTLRDAESDRLTFVRADLSSMREAARVGRELPVESADVLLFTTGIIAAKTREETGEGIERDLAISFLSRLAVLQGAHARIGTERPANAQRPRVFVMGSPGNGALGDVVDLNANNDYGAMVAHANTIAGNEAIVIGAAQRFPEAAFFGIGPGLVKTDIRANFLGEGSVKHRLTEAVIGVLAPSVVTYARRTLPVLFAPELEGRAGVLFDRKGRPILPSRGFDAAHADRLLTASDEILERALASGLA